LSEERSVCVSPAEPQYYDFKFQEDIETVLLRVDSDDDICMTVSIQNKSVSFVVMLILPADCLAQWIRECVY
jgi:hypothetical protein